MEPLVEVLEELEKETKEIGGRVYQLAWLANAKVSVDHHGVWEPIEPPEGADYVAYGIDVEAKSGSVLFGRLDASGSTERVCVVLVHHYLDCHGIMVSLRDESRGRLGEVIFPTVY